MIYLTLFWTFFKIGLFTFGGGYAMLPLIQSEVAAHGWMGSAELVNFVAVSESTPGPFAVNISTYVGTRLAGIPGAFCATLGVVLPSFIIILIVAHCYEKFRTNRIVRGCMSLIFEAGHGGEEAIPLRLVPVSIGSTWLTHLFGGSAGREGVAVQIGGALGGALGARLPGAESRRLMVVAGMYLTAVSASGIIVWEYEPEKRRIIMQISNDFTRKTCAEYGIPEIAENGPETLAAVVAESDRAAFLEMYRRIDEGAAGAACEVGMLLGGRLRYWKIICSAVRTGGALLAVYCTGQDVTAKYEDQERFRSAFEQVLAANPDSIGSFRHNLTANWTGSGHGSFSARFGEAARGTVDRHAGPAGGAQRRQLVVVGVGGADGREKTARGLQIAVDAAHTRGAQQRKLRLAEQAERDTHLDADLGADAADTLAEARQLRAAQSPAGGDNRVARHTAPEAVARVRTQLRAAEQGILLRRGAVVDGLRTVFAVLRTAAALAVDNGAEIEQIAAALGTYLIRRGAKLVQGRTVKQNGFRTGKRVAGENALPGFLDQTIHAGHHRGRGDGGPGGVPAQRGLQLRPGLLFRPADAGCGV